jgi:hypothetical protein
MGRKGARLGPFKEIKSVYREKGFLQVVKNE